MKPLNITVVLIVLIISFLAVTVFSLMALVFVRNRERRRESVDAGHMAKTIEELDTALNVALSEINRLGAVVQSEVDEKYKAVLFLYNLVEDKQKEIEESADGKVISDMIVKYMETHGAKLLHLTEAEILVSDSKISAAEMSPQSRSMDETTSAKPEKKLPKFTSNKHKEIWGMRESGKNVPEIAKELSMGQGEIKLILDLIDKNGHFLD